MNKFTVANQKGGVGKTTLSVHMAFRHADNGKSVLFIDYDSQRNSTSTLAKRYDVIFRTIDLFDEDMELPDIEPEKGKVYVIEASADLADVERYANKAVLLPAEKLKKYDGLFDYCIQDTPPSLGLRLIAALIHSDFVVSPFELTSYSTEGIIDLHSTIDGVKQQFNPELEWLGMMPNRVNSHSKRQKEALKDYIQQFQDYLINQPLVTRDSIEQATDEGVPVWEIKKSSARVASQDMEGALEFIDDLVKRRAIEGGAS